MEFLWIVATVLFAVLEMSTIQLVSIWFALGSLVAFVFAQLGFNISAQIFVFIIISAACVCFTRPFIKKFIKNTQATNADGLIGKKAVITKDIDNINSCGEVKINGLLWSARSINDEIIKKDEIVTIEKIEGVKLIVKK